MLIKTKNDAIRLLKAHKEELKKLGIIRLGLFGSFVRDTANEESDVDVLVLFEPEQKTLDNFMNLSFFLEELFERKVDLVTVESLSPYISENILKEVEYV